jgi:hypothetical protein
LRKRQLTFPIAFEVVRRLRPPLREAALLLLLLLLPAPPSGAAIAAVPLAAAPKWPAACDHLQSLQAPASCFGTEACIRTRLSFPVRAPKVNGLLVVRSDFASPSPRMLTPRLLVALARRGACIAARRCRTIDDDSYGANIQCCNAPLQV